MVRLSFRRSKSSQAGTLAAIEPLENRVLMSGHHHFRSAFLVQTNLVSDQPGVAAKTDANLVNAWGIAFGGQSPFWVNANGSGVSEAVFNPGATPGLYDPQTITIPPASGNTGGANPTGIVFNNTTGFVITNNGSTGPADYIFAAEDGSISAWRAPGGGIGSVTTPAVTMVDNSASGAVYKGLALGKFENSPALFAANFHAGTVDMFDSSFHAIAPPQPHAFTDSRLPIGYAPFDIVNDGPNLLVTFALQNAQKHDDVAGAHHGFIDLFSTSGTLLRRFAARGTLDSPWGVTFAPHHFGKFSDDVLVGNFGDGHISAFDRKGHFQGLLTDATGNPFAIDGLWGLTFGNGVNAGQSDTLYFAAGPAGESHGLFGSIDFELRKHHT